ncbi:DMT family transporter [Cypionkella sp.]|uniref:DMT family transporter n=1 Tax=Cypionkella sp. TaxID=2811411 RepID=UPI002719F449|nr:DMT family transporter [Cypionkella sp.]MDO8984797.1 DMT family transporter [Cypionkella sp.]MDP1577636.1 DMT family transporter [Cypionkella sp.]MDP2050881.1 DMT family transporter [Cypionkella sp.]
MNNDRILRGILLMLAFCVMAPLLDTASKLATTAIPIGQITTARFLVQGALMLPVALLMRLPLQMNGKTAALITLRAVFLIASTYGFVAGVQVMPIADALAIVFIEPFILLILGYFLFGNPVGPRRIAASIVGFAGALLVIQPSLMHYGTAALYPLGTAFSFAFYMLITQAIATRMHPVTQQLHTSIAGSLLCLPIMLWADGTGIIELDPVMPQGLNWLWLFGVGFWAAASHMCMTVALNCAPASTLAPLHYLEIVTAVALGYLVFGDFPNALTWAGIAIIVASGLYIIHRERITLHQARSVLPPEI